MFKRILVPVDGSQTSSKALKTAVQMAKESGGCLRLVHVVEASAYLGGSGQVESYPSELIELIRQSSLKMLDDAINQAKAEGVQADAKLFDAFDGRLADMVSDAALDWQADLVVVGTHGRRGVGRMLLGSGAEQILRQTPVPVLVIRSDEAAHHKAA